MVDLVSFSERSSRSSDFDTVWSYFKDSLIASGFSEVSYQSVSDSEFDHATEKVYSNLVAHPWVEASDQKQLYKRSPLVKAARTEGQPIYWADVRASRLCAAEVDHLSRRDAANVAKFGVTIPVFGPFQRLGYVGLDLPSEADRLSTETIAELRALSQTLHLKWSDIAGPPRSEPLQLSLREKQTMRLMAKGLSNFQISKKMGVSKNTVDTFVRRAFAKLETTDRVSAVQKFKLCDF